MSPLRPALKPSLARRHLLASALVTLVALAALGGGVGFASAGEEDALPATLAVADPRTGDHALYDVEGWGNVTEFSVERGEPRPVRDRHGAMVLAEPWDGWYEAGTGRLVAVGFEEWQQNEEVRDSHPLATSERWSLEDLRGAYVYPEEDVRTCWLHNAFQGRTVPLDAPVRVFGGCRAAGTDLHSGAALRAAAVETVAGHTAVRFDGAVTAWFAPEVPYPVALDVPTDNGTATFRLRSFEAGDAPAPTTASLGVVPAAGLEYRARLPWGFDDAGIDHPWTASAAYAAARDDLRWSVLRDWIALHPDHYPIHMEFHDREFNGDRAHSWDFTLVAETSELDFTAERRYTQVGDVATDPFLYEFYGGSDPLRPGQRPHPDQVPAAWPTVASLQARTHGFVHEAARINVTSWQMRVLCLGCDDPFLVTVIAEHHLPFTPGMQGIVPDREDDRSVRFDMRFGGEAVALSQRVDAHTTQPTLVGTEPQGSGPAGTSAAPPEPLSATTAVWSPPSPRKAAGAGLVALLVGAAYWLWPSVKAAPALGLFSRLRRPELLGHPARRRLVDLIEAEPGIHFAELLRRSGASNGSASHHLNKLVDADLVRVHHGRGYTCYYPSSVGRVAHAAPALRSDTARTLLRTVVGRPGSTTGDTARAAGVTAPNATHHLKRMREAGLLSVRRDGRALRLYPTDEGEKALAVLVTA